LLLCRSSIHPFGGSVARAAQAGKPIVVFAPARPIEGIIHESIDPDSEEIVMDCRKQENIDTRCTCSYEGCSRKGVCCDCLAYHLKSKQLPGCCFPKDAEATYDRSFEAFANAWGLGK
jgi:hypothetical protein